MPEELSLAAEAGRKALHLLALIVPLLMAWAGRTVSLWVLIPLSLLAVSGDVLRARSRWFREVIDRYLGFLMRRDERPPLGGPVRINGATWVLLSAALLGLVFPLEYAVPAFASFMVGDAAAALIGRRYGRITWGEGPRTVEGSAAFVALALATILQFPSVGVWAGGACVLLGTVAEALPGPLNDNLRVPLVMAAVLLLVA